MENVRNQRTGDRGFTLIELLTVIAIIGILAALLLPSLVGAKKRARITQVQRMVQDLELAVRNFYFDYNQYPWDPASVTPMVPPPNAGSIVTEDVIRELTPTNPAITKGNPPTINTQLKDYLTVPDSFIVDVGGAGTTLVDVWNQEYRFMYNSQDQKVIIWSIGEMGVDDTGDGDNIYGDDIHNQ